MRQLDIYFKKAESKDRPNYDIMTNNNVYRLNNNAKQNHFNL